MFLTYTQLIFATYMCLGWVIRRLPTALEERIVHAPGIQISCTAIPTTLRNHAAFWDGKKLTLAPAFDICPQGRAGNEASQAMRIYGNQRLSRINTCLEAAHNFMLSPDEARAIYEKQRALIEANWETVCGEANLDETNRKLLRGWQFLNPFSLENV